MACESDVIYYILGTPASGTSVVAAITGTLGLYLGPHLSGHWGRHPYYGGETQELCRYFARIQATKDRMEEDKAFGQYDIISTPLREFEETCDFLDALVPVYKQQAKDIGKRLILKHPEICIAGPHLFAYALKTKIIHVVRPAEASIAGLARRFGLNDTKVIEQYIRKIDALNATICKHVSSADIINVEYNDLVRNPKDSIIKIIDWLETDSWISIKDRNIINQAESIVYRGA